MACCDTLSRASQSCIRCCCILFCIFLCIGPFLILAGILVFILPGLQVASLPQVRTYNTQVRLFSQVESPLIQQSQFLISSAIPLLGAPFNDYNRLTVSTGMPALQGIIYGLSTIPGVAFVGMSGGVLSTITQFFSLEARLNGKSFVFQQYVPVRRLVSYPVICSLNTTCTNMSVKNCPALMKTYSGSTTCARNAVCGTCSGRMYVSRLCFLVQPSGAIWVPASRQGCYYPFKYSGDYRAQTPVAKLGTTVRHVQDPHVLANDLTKGTMNFDIQVLLPEQTRLIALTLIISGAIFSAIGCLISCCLYNSENGRKCYYRAMGDDDEKYEEEEVMVMQGPPGMMQGPPGMMQGPPGMMQGPPMKMQGPPGMMQGPPGMMQGPPGMMQGPPMKMQGPPGMMQGPPGMMQGPPGMAPQPGMMQGNFPMGAPRNMMPH